MQQNAPRSTDTTPLLKAERAAVSNANAYISRLTHTISIVLGLDQASNVVSGGGVHHMRAFIFFVAAIGVMFVVHARINKWSLVLEAAPDNGYRSPWILPVRAALQGTEFMQQFFTTIAVRLVADWLGEIEAVGGAMDIVSRSLLYGVFLSFAVSIPLLVKWYLFEEAPRTDPFAYNGETTYDVFLASSTSAAAVTKQQ